MRKGDDLQMVVSIGAGLGTPDGPMQSKARSDGPHVVLLVALGVAFHPECGRLLLRLKVQWVSREPAMAARCTDHHAQPLGRRHETSQPALHIANL